MMGRLSAVRSLTRAAVRFGISARSTRLHRRSVRSVFLRPRRSPLAVDVGCDWLDLTIRADVPLERVLHQRIELDSGAVVGSAIVPVRRRIDDAQESGSTKIIIKPGRVAGEVFVSGNLGRWGKQDNVWQPSVSHCVGVNLPRVLRVAGASSFDLSSIEFHRIDLCQVVAVRREDSYRFLSWCAGQSLGRLRPSTEAHGVYWGRRSAHRTAKVYDKFRDLRRRGLGAVADAIEGAFPGVVFFRRELQLRRTLETWGLKSMDGWDGVDGAIEDMVLGCQFRALDRGGISYEEALFDLESRRSRTLAGYLSMWRDGVDLARTIPERSYRRIRAQVRAATGIDLSLPPDVTRLSTRVTEVVPVVVDAPEWYKVAA